MNCFSIPTAIICQGQRAMVRDQKGAGKAPNSVDAASFKSIRPENMHDNAFV